MPLPLPNLFKSFYNMQTSTKFLIGFSGIVLASIWFKYKLKSRKLTNEIKKSEPPLKRHIFIDIETTGLWHKTGDKIVEIACFYFDTDGASRIFKTYVNPDHLIPENVIKIHGINNEMVKDAPKFREVGQQLLDFIGDDDILVGHNLRKFDIPFINSELKGANLNPINNELIDTLEMFREQFPGHSGKLDNVCKMFNIDISERIRNGHGALLDAQLTAACFRKMTQLF